MWRHSIFFSSVKTLQDYSTDVELMGHPLPVLTNPNHHLNSRTERVWPQANDTLAMPAGVITFSNDDLCCLEPNHNRPLFVSVEHINKLVRRALVDQGSCINILPFKIFKELGYGRENLVSENISVTSISPVSTDTLGCLSLHISVGPFSMPHVFHVMDVDPMWHMLLGRPWIHDHRCVPSS